MNYRFGLLLFLLMFCVFTLDTVSAQEPTMLDGDALESFVDDYMAQRMADEFIPGAAVVIVSEGEVILQKGYGFANLESKIPATADKTVFRMASTSKMFTASAIMQLVEQGKLDLHADVNIYLTDYQIEEAFGEPVTLWHILTHTTGFDEVIPLASRDEAHVLSISDYIQSIEFDRINPPGELYRYSNTAFTILGNIIENVSGMTFEEYMQANIFDPLGMNGATFRWDDDLMKIRAVNYAYKNGEYFPITFDYFNSRPASSFMAIPADFAPFMLAHLNAGEYNGVSILQPETVAMMQQVQFTNHEDLVGTGAGLGWFHARHNGYDSYGHSGDYEGAAANMVLIPELNLGVAVAYNQYSAGLNGVQLNLVKAVVGEFFPPSDNLIVPKTDTSISVEQVVGVYRKDRMVHNNAGKLNMFGSELEIIGNGNGTISIAGIDDSWLPVSETYFVPSEDNQAMHFDLAFRTDTNGNVTYLHWGVGNNNLQRVSWYDRVPLHMAIIAISFLTFISTIVWAIWTSRKPKADMKWARLAAGGVSLLYLSGFGIIFATLIPDPNAPVYGYPVSFTLAAILMTIAAILSLVVIFTCGWLWQQGKWSTLNRAYYTYTSVVFAVFIWFVFYWQLVG